MKGGFQYVMQAAFSMPVAIMRPAAVADDSVIANVLILFESAGRFRLES
jgi:hypothetical protein